MDVPADGVAGSRWIFWERPLSDLGITGPDQGKGGKYVLPGPGQEAPTTEGAFVLRSPTFGVMFFYRALDPDPVKAAAISNGVRIYPWAALHVMDDWNWRCCLQFLRRDTLMVTRVDRLVSTMRFITT